MKYYQLKCNRFFFLPEHLTVSPSSCLVNNQVSSLVQPIASKLNTTTILPPNKNGLRLPHFDFQPSEITPTMGCITKPFKCGLDNPNYKHIFFPYRTKAQRSTLMTCMISIIPVKANMVYLCQLY